MIHFSLCGRCKRPVGEREITSPVSVRNNHLGTVCNSCEDFFLNLITTEMNRVPIPDELLKYLPKK